MRRLLLVLVLLATIAVGWAQAAFAAVHAPSGGLQTDHASGLQKLARRVVAYARHQVGVGYSGGGTSPQTGERVRYVPLAHLRPELAGAAPTEVAPADDVYRSAVLATRGFRQSISEGGHNR